MAYIELTSRAKDLTGRQFGRLKALWPANKKVGKNGCIAVYWFCGCDCGKHTTVIGSDLSRKNGGTESCGCMIEENARRMGKSWIKHGLYLDRTWKSWKSMLDRCNNPKHQAYEDYGGRGIKVCVRWRDGDGVKSGFDCFLADVGSRPAGLSIERIDNSKGYEPGNCKWATQQEQMRNMRSNRIITAFGRTDCLAAFLGDSKNPLYPHVLQRLNRGWDAERALTTPLKKRIWADG